MTKKERKLRDKIKQLEMDILSKIDQLQALREDRSKFREHFQQRLKWWIELLGNKSTPNLSWLIEDDAKWLARFERWYW